MTDISADRPATRLATRLAFLATGFGMACWAPLVPFAKARLGVDEAQLGLLLLCLGVGSLLAMPITGVLSARMGSRPMILLGGIGLCALLPVLAFAHSPVVMGLALLVFGASLGTIDVAMNAHAVEVETAAGKPLMSGFHAMFSIGGFAGAGGMTLLLSLGVRPLPAALCSAALTLAAVAGAAPGLLRTKHTAGDGAFVFPRGVVLLIAGLAAVTFLAEGALLDWSALLITQKGLAPAAQGGLGYMLFSIAMTVGRLSGDAVVARLGGRKVLLAGGLLAVAGFVVLLVAPVGPAAMAGFLLIGLGASNIVPVLFSAAGKQKTMPPAMAVAAITTTGYAGILAGPAVVGFVAHAIGLTTSFWLLAGLMCLVPLLAKPAAQ
jgi:predicted MFS family arabinose efflux permease